MVSICSGNSDEVDAQLNSLRRLVESVSDMNAAVLAKLNKVDVTLEKIPPFLDEIHSTSLRMDNIQAKLDVVVEKFLPLIGEIALKIERLETRQDSCSQNLVSRICV